MPSRAPRRTAAKMGLDIVTGVPQPGANSYQSARKSSGLSPHSVPDTRAGTGFGSGGSGYRYKKGQSVGLSPNNVDVNVDNSPQPY